MGAKLILFPLPRVASQKLEGVGALEHRDLIEFYAYGDYASDIRDDIDLRLSIATLQCIGLSSLIALHSTTPKIIYDFH